MYSRDLATLEIAISIAEPPPSCGMAIFGNASGSLAPASLLGQLKIKATCFACGLIVRRTLTMLASDR